MSILIELPLNTWSTLYQQLVNSQFECQPTHMNQSMECQWNVDQGYWLTRKVV